MSHLVMSIVCPTLNTKTSIENCSSCSLLPFQSSLIFVIICIRDIGMNWYQELARNVSYLINFSHACFYKQDIFITFITEQINFECNLFAV